MLESSEVIRSREEVLLKSQPGVIMMVQKQRHGEKRQQENEVVHGEIAPVLATSLGMIRNIPDSVSRRVLRIAGFVLSSAEQGHRERVGEDTRETSPM
jgi:hypothetical protein